MCSPRTSARNSSDSRSRRRKSTVAPLRPSRYRWKRAWSESGPYAVPRTPKSIWLTNGMSDTGAGIGDVCACAPAAVSTTAALMMTTCVRIASSRSLTQEAVARWVVRSVNLRMAVHAAAPDGAVARRRDLRSVVDRRRVTAADVAPLAEHRLLGDQHAIVVRAVRIVAARAVLASRGVVPDEGAALFRVAGRARFVQRVADLQHADVGRSVRAVAGRAVHLPFG